MTAYSLIALSFQASLPKDVLKGTVWDILASRARDGDRPGLVWMAEDAMTAALALEFPAVAFYPSNHVADLHLRGSLDRLVCPPSSFSTGARERDNLFYE